MRSDFSNTVTECPARLSWSAAASPAGPDPTMATRFPVRVDGGVARIQPSSNARSTIDSSMFLIVTGSSLMPSTHDPSQGAGHNRPVKSGKLLVACSRSIAACHRCR